MKKLITILLFVLTGCSGATTGRQDGTQIDRYESV
jgi:hypothetical protein